MLNTMKWIVKHQIETLHIQNVIGIFDLWTHCSNLSIVLSSNLEWEFIFAPLLNKSQLIESIKQISDAVDFYASCVWWIVWNYMTWKLTYAEHLFICSFIDTLLNLTCTYFQEFQINCYWFAFAPSLSSRSSRKSNH